jgi:hypothetical protein
MNFSQFSGLYITAVIAVLVLKATSIPDSPAAIAQNMTGAGNITGGNITAGGINMTSMADIISQDIISQVSPGQEQESEVGDIDTTVGDIDTTVGLGGERGQLGFGDNGKGNTTSDEGGDVE